MKGQSEIIFPIVIGIIVIFVLVISQSISGQALSFHEAQSQAALEQRAALSVDMEFSEQPTPNSLGGVVQNTGSGPMNDVRVSVFSSGVNTSYLAPLLSQQEHANFSAEVGYGDLLLVSSSEGFEAFPVIPEPRAIDGAQVDLSQAARLLVKTAVTTEAFIDGESEPDLTEAISERGGTNYTIGSNDLAKGVEIHFHTNRCTTLGAYLEIEVLDHNNQLTIQSFNGYEFLEAFRCEFPPLYCRTTDLSGVLQQDGDEDFIVRFGNSNEADVQLDYMEFDLRCT